MGFLWKYEDVKDLYHLEVFPQKYRNITVDCIALHLPPVSTSIQGASSQS